MTAFLQRITARKAGSTADRPPREERPVSPWAFAGVAVTSFGGPLALAGLLAPGVVANASASAGLVSVAAAIVFTAAIVIWVRYSRHIASAGGLFAFTEAAAGRPVALLQAGLWIISYLLYLIYTTTQIAYTILPAVIPAEARYQPVVEIAIPVVLAGVMIAGRRPALIVIGFLAVGQLAVTAALSGVTIAHVGAPAASFGTSAPTGSLVSGTAQTALLYICGSLPLFLGGELARPAITIRRGLTGAYIVSAAVVTAAIFPLAAAPAFARAAIPGLSLAQQFAGPGFAYVVGIGIAASVAGVMLVEYLALSRLAYALTSRSQRGIAIVIGVLMVAATAVTLFNPQRIYDDLIKPSLVALWLSQLIVFAVYPRFAARHGQRMLAAWAFTIVATGLTIYGLWTTIHPAAS